MGKFKLKASMKDNHAEVASISEGWPEESFDKDE